ncbi:hypothetical protein AB8O64_36500 (plasmid) [Streptomyces sp. QH1-20]|uniref:hypothetical protein n=1 Tax=Streptomyces sp. QH1-20 TaxID=3240934 RepID=UPI0035167155
MLAPQTAAAVIDTQAALRREVREGFAKINGRFDALEGKIEALDKKIDRNQTQIIELLTALVGRDPGTA